MRKADAKRKDLEMVMGEKDLDTGKAKVEEQERVKHGGAPGAFSLYSECASKSLQKVQHIAIQLLLLSCLYSMC